MRSLIESEKLLIGLFDQKRWILKTNLPHYLLVKVATWKDVQWLTDNFNPIFRSWALFSAPVYFQYGSKHLLQINQYGELMDISIAGIQLNRKLLDVFGMILSSPDRSLSLVHAPSQRQFVVNAGIEGRFMLNVDPKESSTWKRNQYWLPGDLYEFNVEWKMDMQPDSDRWYQRTYHIDSKAPIEKRPVEKADFKLTTRYKLILGPNDEPFHLGENLAMDPI